LQQIIESFCNPKIQLSPRLWTLPQTSEKYGPLRSITCDDNKDDASIETLKISNLARISVMFQNPRLHTPDIRSTYEQLRVETPKLGRRISITDERTVSNENRPLSLPMKVVRLHAALRGSYGMILTLAVTFNAILRALNPNDILLVDDSEMFSNEITTLAEYESQYRPIGASYIPLCLVAAWAAMSDARVLAKIEKIVEEYQPDFPQHNWMEMARALKRKIECLRINPSTPQIEYPDDSFCDTLPAPSIDSRTSAPAGEWCSIM
jgi:hypothetical protein